MKSENSGRSVLISVHQVVLCHGNAVCLALYWSAIAVCWRVHVVMFKCSEIWDTRTELNRALIEPFQLNKALTEP